LNVLTLYSKISPVNLPTVQFGSNTGIWEDWGIKNLFK